jgi:hypothetical protein
VVFSDYPLRVEGVRGEAHCGKIDVLCVDGFASRTVRIERCKKAGTQLLDTGQANTRAATRRKKESCAKKR